MLVIIGLIVGGILVGQNLISAAGVRATITQIEKYNTAVNTFRGKYGGLPGDLNANTAAQFGFTPRAGTVGWGDGNGVIEDDAANPAWRGEAPEYAEGCLFWVDLTTANGKNVNLIDGSFIGGLPGGEAGPCQLPWNYAPDAYFPQAKLGGGNYIYVWSGGLSGGSSANTAMNSLNYYGIGVSVTSGSVFNPGLTVQQAYSIDRKTDDGLPQTGRVIALYISNAAFWSAGGGNEASGAAPGSVASSSATSCYDNGGNASNPMQYSIEVSNGANVNCALSFQFQ